MKSTNDVSRITVDIPTINHKRLKALAAVLGTSMRHLISQAINDLLEESRMPNDLTLKTIKDLMFLMTKYVSFREMV